MISSEDFSEKRGKRKTVRARNDRK